MNTLINKLKNRIFGKAMKQVKPDSDSPWQIIIDNSHDYELANQYNKNQAVSQPKKIKKILIVASVGSHGIALSINSLIAMTLRKYNAEVSLLLCDGVLNACEACQFEKFPLAEDFIEHGPKKDLCNSCYQGGSKYFKPLPINQIKYSDFLTAQDLEQALNLTKTLSKEECFTFRWNNILLGEQIYAATLRFFGKADLDQDDPEYVVKTARHYASSAVISAMVAQRVFAQIKPDHVIMHHGIYIPQGTFCDIAKKNQIEISVWAPSYRNTTVIFAKGDTYHRTFLNESNSFWDSKDLTETEEAKIMDYLNNRRQGKGDWPWITSTTTLKDGIGIIDKAYFLKSLDLNPEKPTFGLLTNVMWDAKLFYKGSAFDNMLEWLWITLDFFQCHPNFQLIVRIHPHEVNRANRQPVFLEIQKKYPQLSDNIKIINYDSSLNTYALMDLCRVVMIFGTKTGMELAPFGTPIIVAGDGWIRNKGISYDPTTKQEYLELLELLPQIKPLSEEIKKRARCFAFYYFFRRMIPIEGLDSQANGSVNLTIKSLEDLTPSKNKGLDLICKGILEDKEFIYDAD